MKRKEYKLTLDRLRERMEYDESIGHMRWKNERRSIAGTAHGDHRRIFIDGEFIYEHILIWFYVHGQWPAKIVDHIDVNGANNQAKNLREATRSENALNRSGANANNRCGFLGVSTRKDGFIAQLRIAGVSYSSNVKATPEEASEAYKELRKKHCPQIGLHG